MARFNGNKATSNSSTASDSWKAAGFLNMYLPTKSGKEKKVGAIPMRVSHPAEKTLNDWLEAKPENLVSMTGNLVIEFNLVDPANQDEFDLGFEASTKAEDAERIGYLNFFLPSDVGTNRKVGYIMLKESDEDQVNLLNWLAKSADNLKTFKTKLIIKHQSATAKSKGFALV